MGYGWMSYVHSHIPYTPYFWSMGMSCVNRFSSHTTSRHPGGSSRYVACAMLRISRNLVHPCSGCVRLFGVPSHLAASLMVVDVVDMVSSSTLSATTVCGSSAISPGLWRLGLARRSYSASARRGTSRCSRRSSERLRIPRPCGSRRSVLPRAARRRTRGAGVWLVWLCSSLPPCGLRLFLAV